MTSDPKDILLSKITALLSDLHSAGTDNGEAMLLLGSAAAELSDSGEKTNWREFKASLTTADVVQLLRQIDTEGNHLLDEDKVIFAYALQIIGMSLAVTSADSPQLQHGVWLLDDIIETALTNYRNFVRTRTPPTN